MKTQKINQTELAEKCGVSKAYISMVLSGKKKPSKRVEEELVNLGMVNFSYKNNLLSHARLPVPALPQVSNLLKCYQKTRKS